MSARSKPHLNNPAPFPVVAGKFFELCSHAHGVWQFHRALFDDNPRKFELQNSVAGKALEHLSVCSQEYLLQQICKLHDRARSKYGNNIGVDYIIRFGRWDAKTSERLHKIKNQLDQFAAQLREVRNKVLSHNDVDTHLRGGILGNFPDGEDVVYFEKLGEFVNLVHEKVFDGPLPFGDDLERHAAALMSYLKTED